MVLLQYFYKTTTALLSSLALGLCLSKPVFAEWDEWLADTEISFSAEDNINNSFYEQEARSDQFWNGFASLGRIYHFSSYTRMDISAQIDGKVHHEFSRLNQLYTGLRLGVRHKFGLGPYQPWIKSYVSSGHIFSRSKIRDGYQTQFGIALGKPLHERIDVELSYQLDHRESSDTNAIAPQRLLRAGLDPEVSHSVYDISGHTVELQFNALLTQQVLLNVGYAFRRGDIVSNNASSLAHKLSRVVDAVARDDVFPGWVYRADGIVHTYSINASYAFMEGHALINLGYQHTGAHADTFSYRNNSYRINFIYNF